MAASTTKAAQIEHLKDRFGRMSSAVFLDFTGMTVQEVSKLRDVLREKGVEYKVVKNTLVKKAMADQPWIGGLKEALRGMTAVAWSFEEPSVAAKVLKAFRAENEKLKIKAGLLEGQVLGARAVEDQLASLPGKQEMRARLLATLNAPAQTFLSLLQAPARNLVGVLAARQRKLGE
jgi:large subunit ribosomal protein L10